MEWFDAHNLARLQFAFTVSFHIIFPSFSIGLASYLAVLNGLHFFTRKPVYLTVFNYWKKIFAVAFGMGVVSGIVMSYEFGTNWSVFADKAGPVVGPLMGYEVMTAFFLEAGFLGVMMFGRERVGEKLHLFATLMVAAGTFASAFWILAVNSWMQTPAGYAVNDVGQFVVKDWIEVIFNPSLPYRLVHMVLAAYLTTSLVVGAVGAYHLLRGRIAGQAPAGDAARTMFSMAMWMAAIVAPIQILAGDQQGLNTVHYQPRKIAAIEGHYVTQARAPLILFGIPDEKAQRMNYVVQIPVLGSLIVTRSIDGTIQGLQDWPPDQRPPMGIVFYAFRVMVGLGTLIALLGFWSLWQRARGRLYATPALHRAAVVMGPAGFIAVLSGWVVTEVGRQPYTVYNLLTTAASASPLDAPAVAFSLAGFIAVYFSLFSVGIYYIVRLMGHPPDSTAPHLANDGPMRAAGLVPPSVIAGARGAKP